MTTIVVYVCGATFLSIPFPVFKTDDQQVKQFSLYNVQFVVKLNWQSEKTGYDYYRQLNIKQNNNTKLYEFTTRYINPVAFVRYIDAFMCAYAETIKYKKHCSLSLKTLALKVATSHCKIKKVHQPCINPKKPKRIVPVEDSKYTLYKITELRELAKKFNIKNGCKIRKHQLIQLITSQALFYETV